MADTLMYLKKLEDAGFSRIQAEAQVALVRDYSDESLAKKQDLKDLKSDLTQQLKDLKFELRQEIKNLSESTDRELDGVRHEISEVRKEIERMSDRITIRLGGMIVVCGGLLAAYLKHS